MIEKSDIEKFNKLGIKSIYELTLIAPSRIDDYTITNSLRLNNKHLYQVKIKNFYHTSKVLFVYTILTTSQEALQLTVFKPKPFHLRQFNQGQTLYIYGEVGVNSQGGYEITHPQVLNQVGGLVAKYNTPLRNDSFERLKNRYIKEENLSDLPPKVIYSLMQLHYPTVADNIFKGKNLEPQILYALKFTELYHYYSSLKKKKQYFKAINSFKNIDIYNWTKSLPFDLTSAQKSVIDDVKNDLSKDNSARRMIIGDVGSGKTMIMLSVVQMVFPSKVVLMAPTTLLANQLYEEAEKFLDKSINKVLVTNKTKKIDLSMFDFIIGTHALLYRELPKIDVIMIDDQHRFGTNQRAMLEKILFQGSKRPHFFQFSATPIPRTQAMIDSALIDVSLITQTPFKKDIITTIISKVEFNSLLEHIKKEIQQNHQVLIVYPLVEQSQAINYQSLEEASSYWKTHFEDVYVTHGKDKNKEDVLLNFRDNGKILLATTVVEVGISLPRLSTVVIVGAERLGLSTLHQLRGRVSRTGLKGWCYLFTKSTNKLRLESFSKIDNGFDIAILDLKYRKSGDLLVGKQQSGQEFKWVDLSQDEKIIHDVQEYIK